MKKLIQTTAMALALAVLGAGSAMAEVDLFWEVDKDKNVTITEETRISKDVEIDVRLSQDFVSAAKADAYVNSDVGYNVVDPDAFDGDDDRFDPSRVDQNLNLQATIGGEAGGSINANSGLILFNQDVGANTNQGNTIVIAADPTADTVDGAAVEDGALTTAQTYVDERTTFNDVVHREGQLAGVPQIQSAIVGSIEGNSGVVGVNQSAGAMNNQHNVLTAAIGTDAAVALADAGLNQYNAYNVVEEVNTEKLDLIQSSINGNSGVVMVNQSSGNMNQQATIINLAALSSTVGFGSGS